MEAVPGVGIALRVGNPEILAGSKRGKTHGVLRRAKIETVNLSSRND
jgi:hypothetical protein